MRSMNPWHGITQLKPSEISSTVTVIVLVGLLYCASVPASGYTNSLNITRPPAMPSSDLKSTSKEPIVWFTATLDTSVQTTQKFLVKLSTAISTSVNRINVIKDTLSDNKEVRTVVFYFTDPASLAPASEPTRHDLDERLLMTSRPGLYSFMDVMEILSNTTHDQRPTGWEFKLLLAPSATNYGMLTLRPNSSAPWGTVCDDFDETSALAACRSVGFDKITVASQGPPGKGNEGGTAKPIYMDSVWCKDPSVNGPLLQNCYYRFEDDVCTHRFVWLVCGNKIERSVTTPIPTNTGAATKTPPAMPSNGSSSGPTNGNSYPHLKPSDIFTVTLNNGIDADTFKNNLARYMDISTSCVELLTPVVQFNNVAFRFSDCGPNASDPKVLEAKLNKLWSDNAAEVMREIGISRMHSQATESTPNHKKEFAFFIALGALSAVVLVGLVVGGIIIYKKRSVKSSAFVINHDRMNYVSLLD